MKWCAPPFFRTTHNSPTTWDIIADKTKLFKSIYSGFTKTNFGSIPYKTENFLVNKTLNNPNINVLCITLDDFINNSFDNYNWDFICQNTSKIFYIFKIF